MMVNDIGFVTCAGAWAWIFLRSWIPAIRAQVFGDPGLPRRYSFTVCHLPPGLVPATTGHALRTEHGLEALAAADTVVVPGYLPPGDPGERVCAALRQAAARGARVVSVCPGAFALAACRLAHARAEGDWVVAQLASAGGFGGRTRSSPTRGNAPGWWWARLSAGP